MRTADLIVAELGIEHFFNIQLVGEHVIEINPRISTIVYQEDLNLPYLGVKRALGEISDDELRSLRLAHPPGPNRAPLLRPARIRPVTRSTRLETSRRQTTVFDAATRRRAEPTPNDVRACRTSTSSSATRPGQTKIGKCTITGAGPRLALRIRPFETSPWSDQDRRERNSRPQGLRVTHCPVNIAGIPWENVQALRRKGVDARLVVFERGQAAPRGRLVARPPRAAARAARAAVRARSPGSRRRPTSSTSTSG